jgi:hypothetical protein
MTDYGKLLTDSLKFGFAPKRWHQIFVLSAVLSAVLFFGLGYNMVMPSTDGLGMVQIAALVVLFVVFGLIGVLISASITHQARNEKKSVRDAYGFAKKRYASLIGAVILQLLAIGAVFGVSFGFMALAFFGTVAGIAGVAIGVIVLVVGLVYLILSFALSVQSVVIGGRGSVEAIKESHRIFMSNIWNLIAVLIIVGLVGYVIALLFQIPNMIAMFAVMLPSMMASAFSTGTAAVSVPASASWIFFITGLVSSVGHSIFSCMMAKALADFYVEKAKKK